MRSQIFTQREKALALVASILLVVMILIGYTKSGVGDGAANSLQEEVAIENHDSIPKDDVL